MKMGSEQSAARYHGVEKEAMLLPPQPTVSWLECSMEVLLNGSYYPQRPPMSFCPHPTENAK